MATNTDKKTIKQIYSGTDISDVAVWRNQDKTMVRIKKSDFDADAASQPEITTDSLTPRTSGGDIGLSGGLITTRSLKTTSTTANEGIGYDTGAGASVVQTTSASTQVEINAFCGQIQTVSLSTAAGAFEQFTVQNSMVVSTDVIIISSATNFAKAPVFTISGVTNGSFVINIGNWHGATALSGKVTLNFAIVNSVIV